MADYYLDVEYYDYENTTATVTWTNGSATVTVNADLTADIATGDYIQSNDSTYGGVWYKVTAISYDDVAGETNITINTGFQQASHTAGLRRNRGDGSQTSPFCHLSQYTSDTVRSPNDVLHCQAGQTLKAEFVIDVDGDGTSGSYITIQSDDWKGTGSTDRFVVNFDGQAVYLYFAYDNYWLTKGLTLTGSVSYGIKLVGSIGVELENVGSYNNFHGIFAEYSTYEFRNVFITNNTSRGLEVVYGTVYLYDSTITGNAYGLYARIASTVHAINTIIDQNTTADVYQKADPYGSSVIKIKGYLPSIVTFTSGVNNISQGIFIEDAGGIGLHKILLPEATITNDDTVTFASGNTAIKYVSTGPSSFRVSEWIVDGLTGGTTYTASVGVKCSNLTTFPTADELYLEVEYFDEATGTHTTTSKSTQVITANDTETTLSVSFTPAQASRARLRVVVGFDISANESIEGAGVLYIENGFTIT